MNLCGLCNGDHLAVEFAVRDSEDDVDGVIDTQKAGVDHEVVGIAGSPDLVGIIVEIVPAYFVDIPDLAEEFFIAVEIEALPGLYEPEFLGGVDIDAEYIRVVREDRVGGSSDDYEGFFLSQLSLIRFLSIMKRRSDFVNAFIREPYCFAKPFCRAGRRCPVTRSSSAISFS